MGVELEGPAARFAIPHNYGTSYECLLDFVQFMELLPMKKPRIDKEKMRSAGETPTQMQ